jgi:hypothetical protein
MCLRKEAETGSEIGAKLGAKSSCGSYIPKQPQLREEAVTALEQGAATGPCKKQALLKTSLSVEEQCYSFIRHQEDAGSEKN